MVKPTTAGYSTTPLWKKLGYKADIIAYVEGAPSGHPDMLALPSDVPVNWTKRVSNKVQFVHFFTVSKAALKTKLKSLRKTIHPDGVIWISWPKKSSGVATDITEDMIREIALPLGLVDIKVCAVDEVWSGLKLMIRKELR